MYLPCESTPQFSLVEYSGYGKAVAFVLKSENRKSMKSFICATCYKSGLQYFGRGEVLQLHSTIVGVFSGACSMPINVFCAGSLPFSGD